MGARIKLGIIKAILQRDQVWRDQAEQFGIIPGYSLQNLILTIIDAEPIGEEEGKENV